MSSEVIFWSETRTFLASNIKNMFDTYLTCKKRVEDESVNAQEFLSKWKLTSFEFTGLPEDTSSEQWFSEALQKIHPLILDISTLLTSFGLKQLSLEWTGMHNAFHEAGELLTKSNIAHHYLALLEITALTERILGQVFLLRGTRVPFLLRDLLSTQELKDLLGKELVNFFRIVMGSVFGLNIRNLAWHGFLGAEDIHPEHGALILFGLHRCQEPLQKRVGAPSALNLDHIWKKFSFFGENFSMEKSDALEIIFSSPFVCAAMRPLWEEAVDLVSSRKKKALLLLLPLLENCLRVLYAAANSRPFSAILTATNSAFYVTLDEILHPWVTPDPASPTTNLVPLYLGRQLTEAFRDLFQHTAGPRVRDRVSHGEVACDDVPFQAVEHLFCLCLLALSLPRWRFLDGERREEFSIICGCTIRSAAVSSCELLVRVPQQSPDLECTFHYSNERDDYLRELYPALLPSRGFAPMSRIRSYEGKFHPCALLKQSLVEIISDLEQWQTWSRPPSRDFSWVDLNITDDIGPRWELPFASYAFKGRNQMSELAASLMSVAFSTIFFSKTELEMVRTLQRIASTVQKCVENVRSSLRLRAASLSAKTLRSRQRESYARQIAGAPQIVSHLLVVVQMLVFIYSLSDQWRRRRFEASIFSSLKGLLKRVLKSVENCVTFTDLSVNKYQEVLEVLSESTKIIDRYFKETK